MRMRKSPSQAAQQTQGMEQQLQAVVGSQMIPVICSHQETYRQLMLLIGWLAAESGINPADFNIDPSSIESIRSALRTATDDDLRRIAEQYEASTENGKGRK